MEQIKQLSELYKEVVMRGYPTGVTIITALNEDNKPIGLTVSSFASVSIDPLMISWCIEKSAGSFTIFKNTDKFAVNILSGGQKDACYTFASRKEKDRFSKIEWELSPNNLPVLIDSYAVLECKKVQQIDAGDHLMFIGEVFYLKNNDADPMIYYRQNVGRIPENWGNL